MKNFSTPVPKHSDRYFQSFKRNVLVILPSLCFALCPFETSIAQEPTDKPTAAASTVRPCSAPPARKNKTKAKGAARVEEFAFACLEAKGSPLEFQEFFQSYVRAQSWQISEERIVEDGWIFSRSLSKDELLQFAKEGPLSGRVNWTAGKALVQVRARELDGGFSRVEISARFQGGGQNVDRFAPPRDSWDLESNGALEKNLIAALDAHVKSLH
ncbi:MAG TPA: hypothetical protein VH114_12380 [Candidatus Acidoferrum sp.]|jgi:hypothetical protein|nr:hypothetical protein [Candidatus Acidoferrum sp.]